MRRAGPRREPHDDGCGAGEVDRTGRGKASRQKEAVVEILVGAMTRACKEPPRRNATKFSRHTGTKTQTHERRTQVRSVPGFALESSSAVAENEFPMPKRLDLARRAPPGDH